VDAAHDVHHLGDAEAHGDAGQRIGVELADLGAGSRSASMESGMGPRSCNPAPGHPGIPARWTSSAKSGVGTAPAVASRVWFTLSHGILNEIYYPRVDYACTRERRPRNWDL
jgi:hypothetical protein